MKRDIKSHLEKNFGVQIKEFSNSLFDEEIICSDCPANKEVGQIKNELLQKNRENLAFKEFFSRQRENPLRSKKVEKHKESLGYFVKKFQDHLEKIAFKKQMEVLQAKVNALEERINDQTSLDISKLKFSGDPKNPFAPKFVNKKAEERFWDSDYTLDQMLEDAEIDEYE